MMNSRFLLAFALAAALPALAAAPAEFGGMDADRDGRISAAEHEAAAQKMFRAMDANRDGKLTAAEMDKASPPGDMTSAQKIKVIDIDGDGVLMAAEHAAGSQKMFSKMDTNRDGYLSNAEWTAGHAALMKKPK